MARQKVLGERLIKDTAALGQALVEWAEDLEKREARVHATEPSPIPSPGAQEQHINPDAAVAQPLPGPSQDDGFPYFVESKLMVLARILQQRYGNLNKVAQLAVLKFIGEEYSTRGPWDEVQDWNAGTGHGGIDFGFRDPVTGLPTMGIPDDWRTSHDPVEKGLTQLDLLDHDLGIANINLKSAALLSGITIRLKKFWV